LEGWWFGQGTGKPIEEQAERFFLE